MNYLFFIKQKPAWKAETSVSEPPGYVPHIPLGFSRGVHGPTPGLGLRFPAGVRAAPGPLQRPNYASIGRQRERVQKPVPRHQSVRSNAREAVANRQHRGLGLHKRQLRTGLQGAQEVHLRSRADGHDCKRLLAHDLGAAPRADPHANQLGRVQQDEVREVLAGEERGRQDFRGRQRDPRARNALLRLHRAGAQDFQVRQRGAQDHAIPLLGLEGLHGP